MIGRALVGRALVFWSNSLCDGEELQEHLLCLRERSASSVETGHSECATERESSEVKKLASGWKQDELRTVRSLGKTTNDQYTCILKAEIIKRTSNGNERAVSEKFADVADLQKVLSERLLFVD